MELNDFFKESDKKAKQYYKTYETWFKLDALDLEDVKQECRMKVIETIRNPKFKDLPVLDLLRLSTNAVNWHLMNIRKRIKAHKITTYEHLTQRKKELSEQFLEEEAIDNHSFNIEKILTILNDKEYYIVSHMIEGSPLRILAEHYKCSEENISQLYNKALIKVKKIFFSDAKRRKQKSLTKT